MSRLTRESFVDSGFRLDLKDLDTGDRAALARAGVDAAALAKIAGKDGVIAGKDELTRLFKLLDGLDRDGHLDSIATTTRDAGGAEVPTASGEALAALEAEVAEARLAHQLGGGGNAPTAAGKKAPQAPKAPEASKTPAKAEATATDPAWLKTAFGELGVSETRGTGATKRILEYFDATYQAKGEDGAHSDDSGKANAWCAAFITWTLSENHVKNGKAVGAREYEKWGEASEPFRGAVVVLQHGKQKHVALLVGVDKDGNNVYLGGNQKNQVSVTTLPGYSVVEVRKPRGYEIPAELKTLPTLDAAATTETR